VAAGDNNNVTRSGDNIFSGPQHGILVVCPSLHWGIQWIEATRGKLHVNKDSSPITFYIFFVDMIQLLAETNTGNPICALTGRL
jgi:hypothetical protein